MNTLQLAICQPWFLIAAGSFLTAVLAAVLILGLDTIQGFWHRRR